MAFAHAQHDTTRVRLWWLAYKVGSSQSNVSEFQKWTLTEGLTGVKSVSRNRMIGFDIMHIRNRMIYGLSSDFELRTFGGNEPYFFSLTFRAGYEFFHTNRLQLRSLGGLGAGYAFVRFEDGIPASLQDAHANYSDPYTYASALIGRLELLASYQLFRSKERKLFHFYPLIYVNASYQPVLSHGGWWLGEKVPDIDGDRFVGQRIYMPKFYQGNWFLTVGAALSIGQR
jgi:hypothetical protein